jgi:hypothetical protein
MRDWANFAAVSRRASVVSPRPKSISMPCVIRVLLPRILLRVLLNPLAAKDEEPG